MFEWELIGIVSGAIAAACLMFPFFVRAFSTSQQIPVGSMFYLKGGSESRHQDPVSHLTFQSARHTKKLHKLYPGRRLKTIAIQRNSSSLKGHEI